MGDGFFDGFGDFGERMNGGTVHVTQTVRHADGSVSTRQYSTSTGGGGGSRLGGGSGSRLGGHGDGGATEARARLPTSSRRAETVDSRRDASGGTGRFHGGGGLSEDEQLSADLAEALRLSQAAEEERMLQEALRASLAGR